jgi:hypothetical protein
MQFYDAYFRKFGIRKPGMLMSPVMAKTTLLELPQMSIYHYLGSNNGINTAPDSNEYMFRFITRPIAMEHVLDNGAATGLPQRHKINVQQIVRQYHARHRRYRLVKDLVPYESAGMTLVVENYGFIPLSYKYTRNILADYYRWYNQQAAMWIRAAELAVTSNRHQFIKVGLPTTLPSVTDLNMAAAKMNAQSIHHIHEPEGFFILELWKWLGDQRELSLFSKIPQDKLSKINIIFEESGRWLLLNLGLLDQWRELTKGEKEELEKEEAKLPVKPGIDYHQLRRRVLRMLMTLFQNRSVDGKVMQAGGDPKKDTGGSAPSSGDEATLTTQEGRLPIVDRETGQVKLGQQTAPVTIHSDDIVNSDHDDKQKHLDDLHLTPDQERHLEADLQELERISKNVVARREEEQALFAMDDAEGDPIPGQGLVVGLKPVRPAPVPVTMKELKVIDPVNVEYKPIEVDHSRGVVKVLDRLAEAGMLSAAEYRRYHELSKKHETIVSPDGKSNLKEFVVVQPETIKIEASHVIPDKPTIIDKTMLASSLHTFDEKYINEVLQKDIAAMVLNIQNAGYCITDYEVELVEQRTGNFYAYTCRVVPIEGAASTLRWKLPAVQSDGVYISNGVRYRFRKQKGDLPFRKIEPGRVAMSSYYGKVFLSRSEKKVNDYGNWLRNNVMAAGLDDHNHIVTQLHPASVFDNEFVAPRLYTIFAHGFRSFAITPTNLPEEAKFHTLILNFDHTKREELFGRDELHRLEKGGSLVVGVTDKKDFVVMDREGWMHVVQDSKYLDLPSIELMLNLDALKAPDDFVELSVYGKTIPLGIILGYEMGLNKLMDFLGVVPRRVAAGKRVGLEAHEYSLVFADETLVFQKRDRLAASILAGFQEYHRGIRMYSVYEFDKRGVYLNILETQGLGARYLREVDLLNQLWVDPITREMLVEMKEPVEFQALLLRGAEMLLFDQHPRPLDAAFQRIKGYERWAGAVYSELIKAIKSHIGKPGRSKQPLDMSPFAVWTNISEDPSKAQVKDINPIENLKQQEAVTYSGTGGRNSRSMTKNTRAYDENDMGVISESTVDSGDVAVNTYTSADPQFISLRGVSKRYEIGKTGHTALLSTSALVSVGSDRDDPKRVNFIAIQQGHGVACAGYHANPIRTGYEQVIAHRTGDLFATTAKKPGKVLSLDEHGIVVQYDDGTKQGIELGRRFGAAEGATIPHEVRAALKLGQKFKVGDVIAYNEGFFEQDLLDPSQVIWKPGVTVRVALMESPLTLEDSSAISRKTADLLRSKTTKIREIIVDFKQSIRELVKLGQAVESEDILCVIEDETTARNDLFDKESLDTLKILSAQSPKAKVKGTVERIEVYYHGEKDDMSEGLRSLATASDRQFIARDKAAGKTPMTGQVDDSYRVDGDPLTLDTMAIRIYITADVPAGVGDKGVFANQLKTVFGQVIESDVKTESGLEVGAIFGAKSIQARIVHSPDIIGTSTVLMRLLGERVVRAYRGK